jgi:hypothetical protein
MNEGMPNLRLVGSASDAGKESVRQYYTDARYNHMESMSEERRNEFQKDECEKYPIEVEMIHLANEEISALMKDAGVEAYDIPVENIHILPRQMYEKVTGSKAPAVARPESEMILLNADQLHSIISFYAFVAHELLHLKAHKSVEVQEKDYDHTHHTPYRSGVSVHPSQQKIRTAGIYSSYFDGLHEAIVTETERKLVFKLLAQPDLAEEQTWLQSEEARDIRHKIAERYHMNEGDIIWIDREDHTNFEHIGYSEQRHVFTYVCNEIQKQFPDQFKTEDDVYKVFLNAHLNGRLLPIARLVEETFGKGSFRILGGMSDDKESPGKTIDLLKKMKGEVPVQS